MVMMVDRMMDHVMVVMMMVVVHDVVMVVRNDWRGGQGRDGGETDNHRRGDQ